MNPANLIGLAGVISGSIAFVVGLLQYARAQKWKRAEFAAKKFKEFKPKPAIANANAMPMLDWNSRIYEIGKTSHPGADTDQGQSTKNEWAVSICSFGTETASLTHFETIWSLEKNIFEESDRFSKRQLRYLLTSPNTAFRLCHVERTCIGYGIALINRLRNVALKCQIYKTRKQERRPK